MMYSHSDLVSALCHVEAGKYVVSGSISGDVYVNDHDVGTRTRKINLGENGKVSSITRCPFNTNVFMVGNCRFESEMSIYDIRDCSKNSKPALTLEDSDSTIKLRQNHPAWDSVTGLIFAPMRGRKDRRKGGFVNIWDPRFVKNEAALQERISLTGWNTHSVDLVKTVAGRDRVMVTATDDHIGFTTFSCKKINN
ncbi:hypothetical protein LPJ73_003892 [Coemansia sp. RSA 2703]|nr:hypothetical protein LPJ73_003892 [Coemansia sp. RSA 2703]